MPSCTTRKNPSRKAIRRLDIMQKQNELRRSGAKIMASLIVLLGSLSYIMVGAIINECWALSVPWA
jgi:hypothetical protein